jgi:hypothetical protein
MFINTLYNLKELEIILRTVEFASRCNWIPLGNSLQAHGTNYRLTETKDQTKQGNRKRIANWHGVFEVLQQQQLESAIVLHAQALGSVSGEAERVADPLVAFRQGKEKVKSRLLLPAAVIECKNMLQFLEEWGLLSLYSAKELAGARAQLAPWICKPTARSRRQWDNPQTTPVGCNLTRGGHHRQGRPGRAESSQAAMVEGFIGREAGHAAATMPGRDHHRPAPRLFILRRWLTNRCPETSNRCY